MTHLNNQSLVALALAITCTVLVGAVAYEILPKHALNRVVCDEGITPAAGGELKPITGAMISSVSIGIMDATHYVDSKCLSAFHCSDRDNNNARIHLGRSLFPWLHITELSGNGWNIFARLVGNVWRRINFRNSNFLVTHNCGMQKHERFLGHAIRGFGHILVPDNHALVAKLSGAGKVNSGINEFYRPTQYDSWPVLFRVVDLSEVEAGVIRRRVDNSRKNADSGEYYQNSIVESGYLPFFSNGLWICALGFIGAGLCSFSFVFRVVFAHRGVVMSGLGLLAFGVVMAVGFYVFLTS